MTATTLESTAHALVSSGGGVLAADGSFPTIEKRFNLLDIASTEETRRACRERLFATAGQGKFINGEILCDEPLREKTGGASLPEVLIRIGMIAGIKTCRSKHGK